MNKKIINIGDLFLFLYLFFLSFFDFTPFYLICGIIFIFITLFKIVRNNKVKMTSYIYLELFVIFYSFTYIVLDKTINPTHTINAIKTLLLNTTISFAVMNHIDNYEKIEKIMKWFIPISIFSSLFIIIYSHGGSYNGRLGHGLVRLFSDTNYTSMEFAAWALYGSVFCLVFYILKNKKIFLSPIPLFAIIIIWGGSRKYFALSLFLFSIIYLLFKKNKYRIGQLTKYIKLLAIIIVIIISIFKIPVLYEKVGSRMEGFIFKTESSVISRSEMKKTAYDYIKKSPIFGYGLDTFRDVNTYKTWSESAYTELAFGCGLPFTIIYYLYFIFLSYKLFKRREKSYLFKLFGLITIAIIAFDIVGMSYIKRLESFLFTISSVLMYLDKKEK